MRTDVERLFDLYLSQVFKENEDVKRFLLTHERKALCIDRLCEQIRCFEVGNLNVNVSTYKKTIESIAQMFAHACLQNAQENALSESEKRRKTAEADRMKNLEAEFEELQRETLKNTPKIFT